MAKSPEAFRTISEVASELAVPQHVLRFWETRFSQVRPMKRGGGRRYYRPEDLALLKGIHRLLYNDGFTIKGVQKILRERGAQEVVRIGAAGLLSKPETAAAKIVALPVRRTGADAAVANADPASSGAAVDELSRTAILHAIDELASLKSILQRARD